MILELMDVCKEYYRGKSPVPVLKNVNLEVEKGEYLAIMGPSGSGKTTLMNLIGCLDLPTSGRYFLDGQDVSKLTDNALAEIRNRCIGFVFQSFHLLPKMTALENVALPLLYAGVGLKQRRELAQKALTAVGLADRMRFYPNQLSGGQCQRVAIARAIVTEPKLLLADEPTGALDSEAGQQIMDIFEGLAQAGMTIIMITHEQEIAARAHRICHIRDGELQGGIIQFCGQSDRVEPAVSWDTPVFPEETPEEPVFPGLFADFEDSPQEPVFPGVTGEEPAFPDVSAVLEETEHPEAPAFSPVFPDEPVFPSLTPEDENGGQP